MLIVTTIPMADIILSIGTTISMVHILFEL